MTICRFACVLAFLSLGLDSLASTIHVPQDQPTIQAGIDAATNGDTVLVAPGTFVENINFIGKAITVESSGGPSVTIIDGAQRSSVVTFNNGETLASVLSGFTIQYTPAHDSRMSKKDVVSASTASKSLHKSKDPSKAHYGTN